MSVIDKPHQNDFLNTETIYNITTAIDPLSGTADPQTIQSYSDDGIMEEVFDLFFKILITQWT